MVNLGILKRLSCLALQVVVRDAERYEVYTSQRVVSRRIAGMADFVCLRKGKTYCCACVLRECVRYTKLEEDKQEEDADRSLGGGQQWRTVRTGRRATK